MKKKPTYVWVVLADYGLNGSEPIAVFQSEPSPETIKALEAYEVTKTTGYSGLTRHMREVLA